MCLHIDLSKHKWEDGLCLAKKATEDILVWKVITKDNLSVWRHFIYRENKLFKTQFIQKEEVIYNGYHAYTSRKKAREEHELDIGEKIVRFTIPKGARYFMGLNNDVASNMIKSGDLKHCR